MHRAMQSGMGRKGSCFLSPARRTLSPACRSNLLLQRSIFGNTTKRQALGPAFSAFCRLYAPWGGPGAFYHHKIRQRHACAQHLLAPAHAVAALFKKGPCRDGGMHGDRHACGMLLQRRAQGCGDASALIVLMDIQPVKIARAVNIAKADNRPVFLCHKGIMPAKAGVPGLRPGRRWGPGRKLAGGIIPCIHRVHRLVKQPPQRRAGS